MMANAGNVISIAFSMAIVSSSITPEAMQGLFAVTQVGSQGFAVNQFVSGLRTAFTISFFMSLLAAAMSFMFGNDKTGSKRSKLAAES